jgi:AcrR family transcriptional regulator
MNDASPAQERQDMILDAAFQAFATYGYRRATMDDIAKGAGISRSALYLNWRNKEDMFRALALRHFEQSARDMASALARPGQDAEAALTAAFVAKDGKFMETVLTTPHGEELMDAGFRVTADLVAAGEARMEEVLALWLRQRGLPAGIGSPEEVAGSILTALKGLKTSARSLEAYRAGQSGLARLFARAIS